MRFAVDGPAVVVPARVAVVIEAFMRRHGADLDELRNAAWSADQQLHEVLVDWHAVALMWRQDASAVPGSGGRKEPEVGEGSEARLLSASEVAQVVHVTGRAVRLAASAGRLRGEVVSGRWQFDADAVADWVAARAAA